MLSQVESTQSRFRNLSLVDVFSHFQDKNLTPPPFVGLYDRFYQSSFYGAFCLSDLFPERVL